MGSVNGDQLIADTMGKNINKIYNKMAYQHSKTKRVQRAGKYQPLGRFGRRRTIVIGV